MPKINSLNINTNSVEKTNRTITEKTNRTITAETEKKYFFSFTRELTSFFGNIISTENGQIIGGFALFTTGQPPAFPGGFGN